MPPGFLVCVEGPWVDFNLVNDPGQKPGRQVTFWDDCTLAAIVIGRVYYRAAWLARLSSSDVTTSGAASFVAAVYRELGASALEDLEGDFAAVLVDRPKRRLLAWRDPIGLYPLFWRRLPTGFVAATSIRPLFGRDDSPRIDPEFVADYLACPDSSMAEMPTQRTAYHSIRRVLPGTMIQVLLPGQEITARTYWDWPRRIQPVRPLTPQDAAEAIRGVLKNAVRERLGQLKTASHFSGGMDSTGLGLIAHGLERQCSREAIGVTLSYTDGALVHEREFVDAALSSAPGFRLLHLPADALLDFAGGPDRPVTDEPYGGLPGYKAQDMLLEAAASAGADTVLSGDGADHIFSVESVERTGPALRLLQLARAKWPRRRATGVQDLRETEVPPWVAQPFAVRYALAARIRAFAANRPRPGTDMRALLGDWVHWNLAVPRGMLQLKPYLDPRVIATALGMPRSVYTGTVGSKPLLAAAYSGVLPQTILHRARKANFNCKFGGYAQHRDWLEHVLEQTLPALDEELVRAALLTSLRQVALGLFADAPTVGRLGAAMSYVLWRADRAGWTAQVPARSPAAVLNSAAVHRPLPSTA